MAQTAKRVLLYRLGSLGDHVVALPSYRLVERAFPGSERRLLTNAPVSSKAPAAAAVLGGSGLVQGYLRYTVGTRSLKELLRLWWEIVRWRPDVLVYLAGYRGEAVVRRDVKFFRMCGVKRIVGAPLEPSLQAPQPLPGTDRWEYEGARLARSIAELGDARLGDPKSFDLGLTEAERGKAEEVLRPMGGAKFFAASLGAKVQSRDWGVENWSRLLGGMARRWPGYGLVLAGVDEESEASEAAAEGWRAAGGGPVLNLCGKLSPRESGAVFSRAELFVGHDSGPMHLAAAAGTRSVGIYAARHMPGIWFAHGAHVRVVYHRVSCEGCLLDVCTVERKRCLLGIEPGEVMAAIEDLLGGGSGGGQPLVTLGTGTATAGEPG